MTDRPRRGELGWCELPQIGSRPVVVLSRDVAIPRLGRSLVAPGTTSIRELHSEVVLEPGLDPITRLCAVNLDSIESVSVGVLVDRIGRLSDERMREVCAALAVAVDGRDTLDKVASFKPDLILLDIMRPKLSGFEVCQQLKADSAT